MNLERFEEELVENDRKIKALRAQFETLKKHNSNSGIDFAEEEKVILDAEKWLKNGWEALRVMKDHPNDPSVADVLLSISGGAEPADTQSV